MTSHTIPEGEKTICPACDGEGERRSWIDGEMNVNSCGRCGGTGKISYIPEGEQKQTEWDNLMDKYEIIIGLRPLLYEILQEVRSSTLTEVEGIVREIIVCKNCNGRGNIDSMAGAEECPSCGGDGHAISGKEGTNIDEIISVLTRIKQMKEDGV